MLLEFGLDSISIFIRSSLNVASTYTLWWVTELYNFGLIGPDASGSIRVVISRGQTLVNAVQRTVAHFVGHNFTIIRLGNFGLYQPVVSLPLRAQDISPVELPPLHLYLKGSTFYDKGKFHRNFPDNATAATATLTPVAGGFPLLSSLLFALLYLCSFHVTIYFILGRKKARGTTLCQDTSNTRRYERSMSSYVICVTFL